MNKCMRDIYSDKDIAVISDLHRSRKCDSRDSSHFGDCVVFTEPDVILTKQERYERACRRYEKIGKPLPERYRRLL